MQKALAAASAPAIEEAEKMAAIAAGPRVRRVPATNFHLTLAFLGSVPSNRLAEVEQVAMRFVQASSLHSSLPIEIVLDAIEHWRKPQVLVATASDTPRVAVTLAESLQRSLVDAGFSPDLKPFRVHATVARKVRRVDHELHLEPVHWHFDSLHLVASETRPEGAAYRTVKKWILDKRD